jgi:predicted secreted protein
MIRNKFFNSRLNTTLLAILIILMIVALWWMFRNKNTYLPFAGVAGNDAYLQNSGNQIQPIRQAQTRDNANGPDYQPKPVSSRVINLTEKDKSSTITVSQGDTIAVTLGNPGDGGYQFDEPRYNGSIIALNGHTHSNPDPGPNGQSAPGDFGRDVWEFTALKSGMSVIDITATRPWNKVDSVTIFSITIKIK